MNKLLGVAVALLVVSTCVLAQDADKRKREDPYGCLEAARTSFSLTDQSLATLRELKVPDDLLKSLEAIKGKGFAKERFVDVVEATIGSNATAKYKSLILKHAYKENSLKQISARIVALTRHPPSDAPGLCALAELMKRVGDSRAEWYYKEAIRQRPDEPAYELFFADYLRNFRGALHPLFSEAEQHYFKGLEKFKQITDPQPFDEVTGRRLERGLVALYQEDGLALFHWKSNAVDKTDYLERPFWFYSSINKYVESPSDIDRVDDTRSFTSEALFASSSLKLNRPLTESELEQIVRPKTTFETLNRFRFRYKEAPAFDLFYRYRDVEDAQITNFSEPNRFNDVSLREYGASVEKSLNLYPYFDLFLRGTLKRIRREGIIEFLPSAEEKINHYETNMALSRFIGPDKVNFDFTYVFQDIDQQIQTPDRRSREIIAGKLTYQLLRPIPLLESVYENRFETRGLDIFVGTLYDRETFGVVDVKKKDYFAGAALKGLGAFDIILQPTFFTGDVEGDRTQRNSQYRTNALLLYRIIDEEKRPEVPEQGGAFATAFLHLVFPFKHDVAISGPKDFENTRIGVELDAKFFTTRLRKTTFLTSLKYDYQRFHRLNRRLHLFSFNISMGF